MAKRTTPRGVEAPMGSTGASNRAIPVSTDRIYEVAERGNDTQGVPDKTKARLTGASTSNPRNRAIPKAARKPIIFDH